MALGVQLKPTYGILREPEGKITFLGQLSELRGEKFSPQFH